jgi:hypothetical protein
LGTTGQGLEGCARADKSVSRGDTEADQS